jgi:hypothetical protein
MIPRSACTWDLPGKYVKGIYSQVPHLLGAFHNSPTFHHDSQICLHLGSACTWDLPGKYVKGKYSQASYREIIKTGKWKPPMGVC